MVLNLFEYNNCKYIADDFELFVDLSDVCRYYVCVFMISFSIWTE